MATTAMSSNNKTGDEMKLMKNKVEIYVKRSFHSAQSNSLVDPVLEFGQEQRL